MNMISRQGISLALAVLAPIMMVLQPATLEAQTQSARGAQRPPMQSPKRRR